MLNNLLKIHLIRAIQKNVKATGDLIDNKITNTIREVSKNLSQNNSQTVAKE